MTTVAVERGEDERETFDALVRRAGFFTMLDAAREKTRKTPAEFAVVIKPNIMVFVSPAGRGVTVTDVVLVERLVELLREHGYTNLHVCESQTDVSRLLKNQDVLSVAEKVGYRPEGRYVLHDLTREAVPYAYHYRDEHDNARVWHDRVGTTWRDADFRITFAKCKVHEHDYITAGVKNVYGCMPRSNKITRYHIRREVPDVTAWSLRSFPVHFSFVDAWTASDGFQGYKRPSPRPLHMLFGGADLVAVDMEVFKRAGIDYRDSRMLACAVAQTRHGQYPSYAVVGDLDTRFAQLGDWENVPRRVVEAIDVVEEMYVSWALLNLEPLAKVADLELFPPKNFVYRLAVWLMMKIYPWWARTALFRVLYGVERRRRRLDENAAHGIARP